MTWSIVTGVSSTSEHPTGSGARPGARMISVSPKTMFATGGIVTDRPIVTTTLISDEAPAGRNERARRTGTDPAPGRHEDRDEAPPGRMSQPCSTWSQ